MIFCKNLLSLIIQASSTPMRHFASAFNIYFYLPIKKKKRSYVCLHVCTYLYMYAHTFSMWLCMNAIHFISFMYKVFY